MKIVLNESGGSPSSSEATKTCNIDGGHAWKIEGRLAVVTCKAHCGNVRKRGRERVSPVCVRKISLGGRSCRKRRAHVDRVARDGHSVEIDVNAIHAGSED